MAITAICRENEDIATTGDLQVVQRILSGRDNLVWVDCFAPTAEEVDWLRTTFGFHELALEDISTQAQRPKIESFDDHVFLVFHGVKPGRRAPFDLAEFYFFLGANYLVSVRHDRLDLIDDFVAAASGSRFLRGGPDFLLYGLVDQIVDTFFPALDTIEEKLDQIEERILERPSKEAVSRLFALKQEMIFLRKLVGPQRDVLNALTSRDYHFIQRETAFYFRDIYDHLIRVYDMLDAYRDLLGGALDVYLSTVSNHLNEVMKRLTVFASVFMPITFITGVFGMNFGVMPQVEYDNGWLWWLSIAFMALVAVFNYLWFQKKKWL